MAITRRSVLLMAAACGLGADEPKAKPVETFRFSIGGLQGRYRVEWDGKALSYEATSVDPSKQRSKTVAPTGARREAFWKAMDEARVWDWSPRYVNADVLDGATWSFEAERDGRRVKSMGRNGYPGDVDVAAMTEEPVPSRRFGKFMKAIESLLGFPFE